MNEKGIYASDPVFLQLTRDLDKTTPASMSSPLKFPPSVASQSTFMITHEVRMLLIAVYARSYHKQLSLMRFTDWPI